MMVKQAMHRSIGPMICHKCCIRGQLSVAKSAAENTIQHDIRIYRMYVGIYVGIRLWGIKYTNPLLSLFVRYRLSTASPDIISAANGNAT